MKFTFLLAFLGTVLVDLAYAQPAKNSREIEKQIIALIDSYSLARETKDSELLNKILTSDIDQLVSSGIWRRGKDESMKGMLRSSSNNPGKRTITVEHIRIIAPGYTIADARYEIENEDGSVRMMWSTFIVVQKENEWKIAAIRNMKPSN